MKSVGVLFWVRKMSCNISWSAYVGCYKKERFVFSRYEPTMRGYERREQD